MTPAEFAERLVSNVATATVPHLGLAGEMYRVGAWPGDVEAAK